MKPLLLRISGQCRDDSSRQSDNPPSRVANKRRSVLGRPRALTHEQVIRVLRWHDSRVTLRQLSKELGVSTSTIAVIVKTRGAHYKQAPPEERAAALTAHRERCARLRAANIL